MRVSNDVIIDAGDMSGDLTSSVISLDQVYGYSVQAVFTGSPNGTLKLQCSDDPGSAERAPLGSGVTNWTDITGATFSITGAGDATFNVNLAFYKWARLVYTRTSGSGSLTARCNTKGM